MTHINFIPKPKVTGNKVLLFDVMSADDRFIFQLAYEHCPLFRLSTQAVKEAVLSKRPTLKNNDFTIMPVEARK